MEDAKNCLVYADIAFTNKQYMESLAWYRKALAITPENIYALSRAGAICVSMGRFEDALNFFAQAKKLDPDNGDNAFNYGNACFFNKDYVKAFEQYVEAEKAGCSDDVKPRLHYQMALLCSMRQDIKSALIYFKKCEESDKTGMISLNPDLISEKLKLYMVQQDYENAEKCAAQLVAINPADFKGYMIYFSILMAHKNYVVAEKLLEDAGRYVQLSNEDQFALTMQKAALHGTKGDNKKAIQILEICKHKGGLTNDQLSQLLLALAETHSKNENYENAIGILLGMLSGHAYKKAEEKRETVVDTVQDLTDEEIEEMIRQDIAIVQDKIDTGALDPNLGLYAIPDYDEEGNLIRYYDEHLFAVAAPEDHRKADAAVQTPEEDYILPKDVREKVVFTLLACHLAKDEFGAAQKLAKALKHSDNKYYSYFGIYTDAMTEQKLTGNSVASDRAIAFFRNKTFADATDTLACIFRARLYAEQRKYDKACEIANLLADADRKAVLDYIESCKR